MSDFDGSSRAAPALGSIFDALTQQDVLDLFARILPPEYLDPLKTIGPGYELLQAYATIVARFSRALVELDKSLHMLTSAGGAKARVTVQLYRQNAGAGALTVKSGTIVTTSVGGRDFRLIRDAAFGGADLGPISVDSEAVAPGFAWNVPGEKTTADGTVLAGSIDTIKSMVQDPAFADPTIRVKQVADATGGVLGTLDQIGADRGVLRSSGESDALFRARIRSLPDTVTPDAIKRAIAAMLDPYGAKATLIETFEVDYQTCWDADDHDPVTFVFDDPRSEIPFRNRWLGEDDHRGAFIVVVPELAAIQDVGMAYDDTAADQYQHVSPSTGGRRGSAAYDVPETASTTAVLQGGYDGFDLPKRAVYSGLWELLQNIKAASVSAIVELEGE
jgi:hypothetical protein